MHRITAATQLAFLAALAGALLGAAAQGSAPSGPTYYVAADQVTWDYAPSGINLCSGEKFTGDQELYTTGGLGSNYTKAQYRQYTDATFQASAWQTLQPKPESEEHTGMMGPVLRAAVGQVVTVVLRNNLPFPINLEPSGLQGYPAGQAGDGAAKFSPAVEPNATVTYRFLVPQEAGPGPMEPAAKMWMYRSTVDLLGHASAGLYGPLLISNTIDVNTGDVASGQERDIITVLHVMDENVSPFLERNLAGRSADDLGVSDADLEEGNLKHVINGYIYCNAPGMVAAQRERLRWHMGSIGSEKDMHNLHVHGNTFLNNGHRADHMEMIPGTARSVQFSTENAGVWLMHCHVGDHILAGMRARYTVKPSDALPQLSGPLSANGTERHYYIQAEEVEWDYAPRGGEFCTGRLQKWTPEQAEFAVGTHLSRGGKFTKALYVEYTDGTFTQRKPQDPSLGFLGPTIRAEVGDTIQAVFKNSLCYPVTLHAHGVAYIKSTEGAPYTDGSSADTADDSVPPGTTYTYLWRVPETTGPGPADPSTIVWMYHSHKDEVADVYAGLAGVSVIGRKGQLKPDLTGKDVDREVVLYFSVINEMHSLYADANAQALGFASMEAWEDAAQKASEDAKVAAQQLALAQQSRPPGLGRRLLGLVPAQRRLLEEEEEEAEGYEEPMLMHAINGFLYCNGPVLNFTQGERVRLHIMALGTEVDLHTPNFIGQSFAMEEQHRATIPIMPGSMHSVDVVLANTGLDVLQCRVADHTAAGMRTLINVTENSTAAAALSAAVKASPSPTRYFIQAEEVAWNYAPQGLDACTGEPFDETSAVFLNRTNATIGSNYTKAVYRAYTDDTFTKRAPVDPRLGTSDGQLGLLGPLLVVEVGQRFEITFRNRLPFPANLILDGGLELLSAVDGAGRDANPHTETPVAPNGTAIYTYYVPESAGPGEGDLSTVAYTYTSSVDLAAHPNAGLVGALVVAAKGPLEGGAGRPAGVDALVPLLFHVIDETDSPFIERNMDAAGIGVEATFSEGWGESNLKHSINGYMYCNMPGLAAKAGATVRFILLGMGSEIDLHAPVITGQNLKVKGQAYHSTQLLPTATQMADVTLDQAGRWPVYCEVHDHFIAGMRATLVVQ